VARTLQALAASSSVWGDACGLRCSYVCLVRRRSRLRGRCSSRRFRRIVADRIDTASEGNQMDEQVAETVGFEGRLYSCSSASDGFGASRATASRPIPGPRPVRRALCPEQAPRLRRRPSPLPQRRALRLEMKLWLEETLRAFRISHSSANQRRLSSTSLSQHRHIPVTLGRW